MPTGNPSRSAVVSVPSWMWGGDPTQFFTEAALHSRAVPRVDGDSGAHSRWRLQTRENYLRARPALVTVEHLAGPAAPRPRLHRLAAAAAESIVPDLGGAFLEQIAEMRARAQKTEGLVDNWNHAVYATIDAPPEHLEEIAAAVHHRAVTTTVEERPGERPFEHAGVHLFRRAPAVVHRGKLASILLQTQYSPPLRTGDIENLQQMLGEGRSVFAASEGLFNGTMLGDAYLGPLLGALSPHVWAFPAHRALGTIIYSLGHPLAGTPGRPAELLHLLRSPGPDTPSTVPTLPRDAAADALDWWATQLSALFGVVTDPAVFTDSNDVYYPAKHTQALLTIEQLFWRVSSIQTVHRDANARRVLLFSVLDTLFRVTGRNIEALASRTAAKKRLDVVAETMSPAAAAILLPGARRALAALAELEHGFYLRRQLGADTVDVPDANGEIKSFDPNAATAKYVKVLRNANHGHGSNKENESELSKALLAHHNGKIPHFF